jgi:hypothetical protein
VPKLFSNEPQTQREPESEALCESFSAETTPLSGRDMATGISSNLNGSAKLKMQETEDHALLWALRTFGPHVISAIGGVLAIFSALYITGFLQPPATKSSVEDLKITVQEYIKHHDEMDAARGSERSARQEYIQRELEGLKVSVNTLLQRTLDSEKHQALIEGILLAKPAIQANPPLPAPIPPYYDPPKPKAPSVLQTEPHAR